MLTLYATDIYSQQEMRQLDVFPRESFDRLIEGHPEWLDSALARAMITEVDQVDVRDTSKPTCQLLLENGLLPVNLCTGTKNVILQKERPGWWCRMGFMGENCYKYLMDVAEDHDVKGIFVNVLDFSDEDLKGREVYFEQLDKYARTASEFSDCICEIIGRGYFKEAWEQ